MSKAIETFMDEVIRLHPAQEEFHQAVREVVESVWPVLEICPDYVENRVLERMIEPDRAILFRVPWMDDQNKVQVNRGFRVEFNSALGPYKGGLRFHRSVDIGVLKFLGFEQIFKNSLTTLNMGGGKGGADFDPKGKSDTEVMRFCQSFMSELFRHIGEKTDVPAGDIGVGGREIGYMFGQYKRLANRFEAGVLTGKGLEWGGSLIRPEATGYGCVYFAAEMLATRDESFEGKRVAISGSGNVAQYAAQKAHELGGKVVSMSDSTGAIIDEDGIDEEKLAFVMDLKNRRRGRIREYADKFSSGKYLEGGSPWGLVDCEVALPCATQNEVDEHEAKATVERGLICVAEGANMPCTPGAVDHFLAKKILFGPGKAANAGGVAVSGLEMAQNDQRERWNRAKVDGDLKSIMRRIHRSCVETAEEFGHPGNYVHGANIAGFRRVANAMLDQGVV